MPSPQHPTNREIYQYLIDNPNYTDIAFDETTGGLKATHIGHHSSKNEPTRYFGLSPEQLDKACQEQLYRMGHRAILRNESNKQPNGSYAASLDLNLDGNIMDIVSVTQFNGMYGTRIMKKNSQIRRAREQSGDISNSLCLYFHDPTMFFEQRLIKDIQWFKDTLQANHHTQRIHHLYVVIKDATNIRKYNL